tara:strand:+ start:3716 stop:4237 length:522 start_codon:yes stop_codon:yes gene_type:complete
MKAYSIVSIILTCIFFIAIIALLGSGNRIGDVGPAAGWAFVTGLYALIFSIVGIIWSTKRSPKNITILVMSIIGLILFFITIMICIVAFGHSGNKWDYIYWLSAAAGWGMIATWYLLPLSIVSLVQAIRVDNKKETNVASVDTISSELEKLDELRRKGIISDQEFEDKKRQIL